MTQSKAPEALSILNKNQMSIYDNVWTFTDTEAETLRAALTEANQDHIAEVSKLVDVEALKNIKQQAKDFSKIKEYMENTGAKGTEILVSYDEVKTIEAVLCLAAQGLINTWQQIETAPSKESET